MNARRALNCAAYRGHNDITRLLLANGAQSVLFAVVWRYLAQKYA